MLMLLGNKARHYGKLFLIRTPSSFLQHKTTMLNCSFLLLFLFCLPSGQADATHERVVKREDGERLAKVIVFRFLSLFARGLLNPSADVMKEDEGREKHKLPECI